MEKTKIFIPKIKIKQRNTKNNRFPKLKIIDKKKKINKNIIKDSDYKLNHSWDFTPFPHLFFPSEKRHVIKELNGLYFKNNLYAKTPSNTNIFKTLNLIRSNSLSNIYKENKGDITKYRPPAFSFGTSRNECKIPFLDFREKISPSPGSYNLRPLEGLGGHSLKFSIHKKIILKKIKIDKNPGPGHYNINHCDTKNNGNIILSNYPNSLISNFSKYKVLRDNNYMAHSEWNVRPEPASYNLNDSITMFKGTGKYPISIFRSNISTSFNKSNSLSKLGNKIITPGPGYYNHHSIFYGNY